MALKGIKVLEFAGLAPVPFCGMVLADFGASVIRIDGLKGRQDMDFLGNGKKSLAVDLKKPEGVKIVLELSKESDVLIDSFRPGVLEKLGLGPQLLCKENPRLIYSRLTGYGDTGKYSKQAGHDINYIAISGLLSLLGRKHEKPAFPINLAADFAGGGLTCAFGIILALFERTQSGKGQVIDSNMVEGAAYLSSWLMRGANSLLWTNQRGDNVLDGGAHFYEVYETKDQKYMAVGAIEPQFYAQLLQGLGLSDVDYFDFDEGKRIFAKTFAEKTQEEWCRIFDGTDACVKPVLNPQEAAEDVHNKERQTFLKIGDLVVPKPAPKLSRTPGSSKAQETKISIGQHSVEILKSLGYLNKTIKDLLDNNVIKVSDTQSKL